MKRLVKIKWSDPKNDWPWFYVLKETKCSYFLKGADYPDGSCFHQGDEFWARKKEIKTMRFIK